jgi:hypothetical protein
MRASVLVMLVVLGGCGFGRGPAARVGEVTGKVSFEKQPLAGGTVTFIGADGKEVKSAIGRNGTYHIVGVSVGTARIGIISSTRAPKGLGGAKQKFVVIPERYDSPETSGLSYNVKEGAQEHDIELVP